MKKPDTKDLIERKSHIVYGVWFHMYKISRIGKSRGIESIFLVSAAGEVEEPMEETD